MDFWRAVNQQLEDWQKAGLAHLPKLDLTIAPLQPESRGIVSHRLTPTTKPLPSPPYNPAFNSPESATTPMPRKSPSPSPVTNSGSHHPIAVTANLTCAERQQLLGKLSHDVAACQRCPHLAATRNKTVFGVGNPEAKIMFIGEAPGADEDEQGIPFVGRAGQLLDKIIAACGWLRDDIYICNILRCRPPGNRAPLPDEAANCREYLDAQIRIVNPQYIICWGATAAQSLLQSKDAIGKMRQKFFNYLQAKVTCTYHPSYLLRNPPMKKEVWEDMKFFLKELGIDPETVPGSQKPA